jgi:CRISPR type III-B/RAMP module RAMP protein Cmr1
MRSASISLPETWPTPGSHHRFIELELRALTPIFKGGSTTTQIDEGRPFRAPSIRGALRYWWRATSTLTDVGQLRARERELFGGVHGASPLASRVSIAILSQQSTPGPRPGNKPYAFGVTGKDPEGEARNRQVHSSASGRLRVEWRDDSDGEEVKRALTAWLLFGGIGGRSRRGAGSIWWDEGVDRPSTIDDYVVAWHRLVPERATRPWPTLAGSVLLVGPARNSADAAWTEGLDGMRDVRASREVRQGFVGLRGADLFEWKRQDYLRFGQVGQFQSGRAALGLPIRFHGTKGTYILNSQGMNRYPSPVHLKVVQLGSAFHPVMLALRGPMPTDVSADRNGKGKGGTTRGTVAAAGLDRFLALAAQLPGWRRHT